MSRPGSACIGRAADIDPSGPNVGRTLAVVRVLSPADLAAELASREQELRGFERLISEQNIEDALERLLPTLPDPGRCPQRRRAARRGLARRQEALRALC